MGHVGPAADGEPGAEEVADWETFLLPHLCELHHHTVPRAFLFLKDSAGDVILQTKSSPMSTEPWGQAQNHERCAMFPRGVPDIGKHTGA